MEPSGLKKKHKACVTSDPCVCHDSVLCSAVLWKHLMSAIQSLMSVRGWIAHSWVFVQFVQVNSTLKLWGDDSESVLVGMDYGNVFRWCDV